VGGIVAKTREDERWRGRRYSIAYAASRGMSGVLSILKTATTVAVALWTGVVDCGRGTP
jgi:hypothetical protein